MRGPVRERVLGVRSEPIRRCRYGTEKVSLHEGFPAGCCRQGEIGRRPTDRGRAHTLVDVFRRCSDLNLLAFDCSEKGVICYERRGNFTCGRGGCELTERLRGYSNCHLRGKVTNNTEIGGTKTGPRVKSPRRFCTRIVHRPSLTVRVPRCHGSSVRRLHLVPLRCLCSLGDNVLTGTWVHRVIGRGLCPGVGDGGGES